MNMNIDMHVGENNVEAPSVNPNVSMAADSASSNDKDVYNYALDTLNDIYNFLASLSTNLYAQIRNDTATARDEQKESNDVDAEIAKISKDSSPDATLALDKQIIDFMNAHGIKVGDKSITEYIKDCTHKGKHVGELDKGELTAVKNALDNAANRSTDLSSQNQLKLQNLLQNLNNTISNESSYIKQRGDMISSIIRNLN